MSRIDAVTPLLHRDLERFRILVRSLERFMLDLGTLFVVIPDRSPPALARELARISDRLQLCVVRERAWVPEMQSFRHLPGWYRQQLVKLAAAQFVTSDFFLTLDADVVCTRRVSRADLLPGGRARCHVIRENSHPDWYTGAEAVLGLQARRREVLHNVTPCVLARAGVLELIAHLNAVAERHPYASGLRGWQQRLFFTLHRLGPERAQPRWRAWLAASRPWAEYATYFTFLEATGRYDAYHFDSDQCIYDVGRSLWYRHAAMRDLDPEPLFAGHGPPYFVVFQSNTGLEASHTWQKLEPWLGPAAARGSAA